MVYYGTSDNYRVVGLSADKGKAGFYHALTFWVYSSPAISAQAIYIGSCNGCLYSFDPATSGINWTFQTEGNKKDSLHLLNSKGNVKTSWDDTSDSTKFESMNKVLSVGSIVSSPVIDEGDVYFGSADGNLYALTEGQATGVNNPKPGNMDLKFEQNYPNPFNPATNFTFSISPSLSGVFVSLKIYDITGKEIHTLVNKELQSGNYSVEFNASSLASGIYFYTLSANGNAGNFTSTKKMTVLK